MVVVLFLLLFCQQWPRGSWCAERKHAEADGIDMNLCRGDQIQIGITSTIGAVTMSDAIMPLARITTQLSVSALRMPSPTYSATITKQNVQKFRRKRPKGVGKATTTEWPRQSPQMHRAGPAKSWPRTVANLVQTIKITGVFWGAQRRARAVRSTQVPLWAYPVRNSNRANPSSPLNYLHREDRRCFREFVWDTGKREAPRSQDGLGGQHRGDIDTACRGSAI